MSHPIAGAGGLILSEGQPVGLFRQTTASLSARNRSVTDPEPVCVQQIWYMYGPPPQAPLLQLALAEIHWLLLKTVEFQAGLGETTTAGAGAANPPLVSESNCQNISGLPTGTEPCPVLMEVLGTPEGHANVGLGVAVGVDVAVAVAVVVAVAVAVAVGVPEVDVAVVVAVVVGVALEVEVGVGVAVGDGTTPPNSNAPMSHAELEPLGSGRAAPRWSLGGHT